jgi:hypothetical protein
MKVSVVSQAAALHPLQLPVLQDLIFLELQLHRSGVALLRLRRWLQFRGTSKVVQS